MSDDIYYPVNSTNEMCSQPACKSHRRPSCHQLLSHIGVNDSQKLDAESCVIFGRILSAKDEKKKTPGFNNRGLYLSGSRDEFKRRSGGQ